MDIKGIMIIFIIWLICFTFLLFLQLLNSDSIPIVSPYRNYFFLFLGLIFLVLITELFLMLKKRL